MGLLQLSRITGLIGIILGLACISAWVVEQFKGVQDFSLAAKLAIAACFLLSVSVFYELVERIGGWLHNRKHR